MKKIISFWLMLVLSILTVTATAAATETTTSQKIRLEAEDSVFAGQARPYNYPVASMGKVAAYIMKTGDSITYSKVPKSKGLVIGYTNGTQKIGKLSLYVNEVHEQDIIFPITGGYGNAVGEYREVSLAISIPENATVKLQFDKDDEPVNIDYIDYYTKTNPPIINPSPPYVAQRTIVNSPLSKGINVSFYTEEEIYNYTKSSQWAELFYPVSYSKKPSVKVPYSPGRLSTKTLNQGIRMVNLIRYIAGVSNNVTLNDDYSAKAQAASLVMAINGSLSHKPNRPLNMEDSLYTLGAQGAASSNLGGQDTLNYAIGRSYMDDSDDSNIDRVGHRRWVINPKMSATGFGGVYNSFAMYTWDMKNKSAPEYGVVWPAQTMPIEYFGVDVPWSISMGYEVNRNDVNVQLVRLRDNREWNFNSIIYNGNPGRHFNVDNDASGAKGCIIFRPERETVGEYLKGDTFQVTISGLKTPVSYQVKFFSLRGMELTKTAATYTHVPLGVEFPLKTNVTPSDASNELISWSSSNEKIAVVSNTGVVTGKSYGELMITAKKSNGVVTGTYKLKVVPAPIQIKSVTSTVKGRITVNLMSDKTVDGYRIKYSLNEDFSEAKVFDINGNNGNKRTLAVKGGKLYYIKISGYVKVKGLNKGQAVTYLYYGDESEVKSVLVK